MLSSQSLTKPIFWSIWMYSRIIAWGGGQSGRIAKEQEAFNKYQIYCTVYTSKQQTRHFSVFYSIPVIPHQLNPTQIPLLVIQVFCSVLQSSLPSVYLGCFQVLPPSDSSLYVTSLIPHSRMDILAISPARICTQPNKSWLKYFA